MFTSRGAWGLWVRGRGGAGEAGPDSRGFENFFGRANAFSNYSTELTSTNICFNPKTLGTDRSPRWYDDMRSTCSSFFTGFPNLAGACTSVTAAAVATGPRNCSGSGGRQRQPSAQDRALNIRF